MGIIIFLVLNHELDLSYLRITFPQLFSASACVKPHRALNRTWTFHTRLGCLRNWARPLLQIILFHARNPVTAGRSDQINLETGFSESHRVQSTCCMIGNGIYTTYIRYLTNKYVWRSRSQWNSCRVVWGLISYLLAVGSGVNLLEQSIAPRASMKGLKFKRICALCKGRPHVRELNIQTPFEHIPHI